MSLQEKADEMNKKVYFYQVGKNNFAKRYLILRNVGIIEYNV